MTLISRKTDNLESPFFGWVGATGAVGVGATDTGGEGWTTTKLSGVLFDGRVNVSIITLLFLVAF